MADVLSSGQRVWRVRHRTFYSYASPVRQSFNETRLMPVSDDHQTLRSFELTTQPPVTIHQYTDSCSNVVHYFDVPQPHESLLVESMAVVAVHPSPPLAPNTVFPALAEMAGALPERECYEYLGATWLVGLEPEIRRLADEATAGCRDVWGAAQAIMRFVHGWLTYTPAATHVRSTVREVLAQRCGVCQDYAHLMLGLCRTLKIPARYVSGYLATEKARATHAWVEVFLPGVGWHAMDATHNRPIDHHYIKIGSGRDYSDVPPVTGYYKGCLERKMEVEVEILDETVR